MSKLGYSIRQTSYTNGRLTVYNPKQPTMPPLPPTIGFTTTKYPPKWDYALKKSIKIRDNYHCQVCNSTTNLQVHHINYDKSDCASLNLITICNSCHYKTLSHKQDWHRLFWEQMHRRFNPTPTT